MSVRQHRTRDIVAEGQLARLLAGEPASPVAGSGASDGQRAPALPRSARRRRDPLIEDMKDLLGRAVIYALALLGLLHVLGLVAAA